MTTAILHRTGFWMALRLVAVAIVLTLATSFTEAAVKCPPSNYIIGAGRSYDQASRAGTAAAFANAAARYSDMRAIAFFALGRHRNLLPKAREAEYISLTRKFMGEFMLEYGKDFRVGTLEIIDCSGPPERMLVNARTSSGDRISFRVHRAGSGFQISDMKVSGIWLVQQMRDAFAGTIRRDNGGIEALFRYLKS